MIDFNAVAPEVFSIIRSRDYVVDIYDANGDKVIEPTDGRRFYISGENHLVALVDQNENSTLKIRLSQSADISNLIGFITSLRTCANKYNMLFDVKRGDREYQPKDFATEYAITNEDYAHESIAHSLVDGISLQHNLETITVPMHPMTVSALDSHTASGGSFFDAVGSQIARMAADYGNLTQCSQYIETNFKSREAQRVNEACQLGMRRIDRSLGRFARNPIAENLIRTNINPLAVSRVKTLTGNHFNDAIVESVSRHLGEQQMSNDIVVVRFAPEDRGFEIDKRVWDDLQNRKIDLMSQPTDLGDLDRFERFQILTPMVSDDRLLALFTYVSDNWNRASGDEARKMDKLITAAVKAARLDEGVRLTGALLEFQSWFNGEPIREDHMVNNDEDIRDIITDFDITAFLDDPKVAEFLQMRGDTGAGVTEDEVRDLAAHHLERSFREAYGRSHDMYEASKDILSDAILALEGEGFEIEYEPATITETFDVEVDSAVPVQWEELGRGSNDDGIQGFYHRGTMGQTSIIVFTHADARSYDVTVEGPSSSYTESGTFLNEKDLGLQLGEVISRAETPVEPELATGSLDSESDLWGLGTAFGMGTDTPEAPMDDEMADDLDAQYPEDSFADDSNMGMDNVGMDAMDDYAQEEETVYEDIHPTDELTGGDLFSDDEILNELGNVLDREDIVIPGDEDQSLKAGVAADIDKSEIDRLAQAAGIRRAGSAQSMTGIPSGLVNTAPTGFY